MDDSPIERRPLPPPDPSLPSVLNDRIRDFARFFRLTDRDGQLRGPVHYWDVSAFATPDREGEEKVWSAIRKALPLLYQNAITDTDPEPFPVEVDLSLQPPPVAFQQAAERLLQNMWPTRQLDPWLALSRHVSAGAPCEPSVMFTPVRLPGQPEGVHTRLTIGGMPCIKLALDWIASRNCRPVLVLRRLEKLTPDIAATLSELSNRHIEGWELPPTASVLVFGCQPRQSLPHELDPCLLVWDSLPMLPSPG